MMVMCILVIPQSGDDPAMTLHCCSTDPCHIERPKLAFNEEITLEKDGTRDEIASKVHYVLLHRNLLT